eukprot:3296055-Rhodomonas_salina.2
MASSIAPRRSVPSSSNIPPVRVALPGWARYGVLCSGVGSGLRRSSCSPAPTAHHSAHHAHHACRTHPQPHLAAPLRVLAPDTPALTRPVAAR